MFCSLKKIGLGMAHVKCYCINSMIQFTSDSAQVVAFVSFVGLAVLLIVEMV